MIVARSLHALILLAVLLWQSWVAVAVFRSQGAVESVDQQHLVQLQDKASVAGSSLHLDADEAPVQHLHSDGGNELLASAWPGLTPRQLQLLPVFFFKHWHSVPADRLLRPPRSFA